MNKTIFDVEDIHELRAARKAEYESMSKDDARKLCSARADHEWHEIMKIRGIINDFYKCPNIFSPQPDKLPKPKFSERQYAGRASGTDRHLVSS